MKCRLKPFLVTEINVRTNDKKGGSPQNFLSYLLFVVFSLATHLPFAQESAPEETSQNEETENTAAEEQEPPKEVIRLAPDLQKEKLRLVEKEIGTDKIAWLEAKGEKYMALWEPETTGNPLGAILFVHGEGQTSDWPDTINLLRMSLTASGWSTLSISVADPHKAPIPARKRISPPKEVQETPSSDDTSSEENTDEAEKTDMEEENAQEEEAQAKGEKEMSASTEMGMDMQQKTEQRIAEIETSMQARIKSALTYLNQKGQYNLVMIGHGIGAMRIAKFFDSLPKPKQQPGVKMKNKSPIRALIFVNARNQYNQSQTSLSEYLTTQNLPILDIFFDMHYMDTKEAKARYKAAKKNQIDDYYQLKIIEPSNTVFEDENQLTRRVRGFLEKHAKGIEVQGLR